MTILATETHPDLRVGDIAVDATHVYWIALGGQDLADLIRREPK